VLAVLIARPDLALAAALAFLLFALFNLLCNRIIIGLFERFQSTRKGRERMVFLMLLVLLLPQLLQFTTGAWASGGTFKLPTWILSAIDWMRAYLPPGLAARIFVITDSGSLWALAGLLLSGGIALLILLRQLRVIRVSDDEQHVIEMPEPVYAVGADVNMEYDTDTFRFGYESMVTPKSVFTYDMESRERALLKQQSLEAIKLRLHSVITLAGTL